MVSNRTPGRSVFMPPIKHIFNNTLVIYHLSYIVKQRSHYQTQVLPKHSLNHSITDFSLGIKKKKNRHCNKCVFSTRRQRSEFPLSIHFYSILCLTNLLCSLCQLIFLFCIHLYDRYLKIYKIYSLYSSVRGDH